MIKFGDQVKVTKDGFFKGAKGYAIAYSPATLAFTVRLEGNVHIEFFQQELKCVKPTKAKKSRPRKTRN